MKKENDLRCTIILFGASGGLTQRMVIPAIFRLVRRGLLSPEFRLIGYARTAVTDNEFRVRMRKAVMRDPQEGDKAAWTGIAARLSYVTAVFDGDNELGEITQMETKRFLGEEKREAWLCKPADYKGIDGVIVPINAEVIWKLEKGEVSYAKFNVKKIEYDMADKF